MSQHVFDRDIQTNAAPFVKLSEIDGIHFDEKAHDDFAHLLGEQIKKML